MPTRVSAPGDQPLSSTVVQSSALPAQVESAPIDAGAGPGAWIGRQIDDYRILRTIGAGGMGVVFLAQQRHPKRLVAIKTLHAGLHHADLLARFQQEAEILARLKHPGIAQVFASGRTDASLGLVPYIVMEYVEGSALLEHSGALDTRARLELLMRICDAVEHAHIRGVIHRDLKPGNILVQIDGQPKVLDFGVARLTGDDRGPSELTSAGMVVGTIAYMSPEQAIGEPGGVDIRTDVYALGMIGYRMLTGDMPYEVTGHNLARALQQICDTQPTPLSRSDPRYRGDLETIFGKALAKDKEARYQNAAELAEDLRRYLNDEAILAQRPSVISEVRRFARRNRALVGAALMVLLALIGSVAISTRFALQEQAQRRQADAMIGFMRGMLSSANPVFAQGREVTVREVMDQAQSTLERDLADAPAARARMHATLAETYKALGVLPRALDYFDAAIEDFALAHEAGSGLELAQVGRARTLFESGRVRQALDQLELLTQQPGDATTPPRLMASLHLAAALAAMGQDERARAEFDRGFTLMAAHAQQMCADCVRDWEPRLLVWAWARRAAFERGAGDAIAAQRAAEQAWALAQAQLGTTDPDVLMAATQLSLAYIDNGRYEEARGLLQTAYDERQRVLGDSHWQTLSAADNLALALESNGEAQAAEALFRDALGRAERGLEAGHPELAMLKANLGRHLFLAGQADEAQPLLADAYARFAARLGDSHPDTLTAALNLAVLYSSQGKYDLARPLMEAVLAGTEARFGPEHRQTIAALSEYASFLRGRGLYAEADRKFEQAWASAQRLLAPGDSERLRVLYQYSGSLQRQSRFAEAEQLSAKLMTEVAVARDPKAPHAILAPLRHARSLMGLGRRAEAEQLLQQLNQRLETEGDAQMRQMTADTLAELRAADRHAD